MVKDGRFRGGSAPYGYRLAPSGILNKRKREVYKLEIDEDEARVVRMMFNLCVGSGYGRCKIANLISGQGIQTRTSGNWHEATVGHILHNITYTGVLRSGESQSEIFPDLQIIDPTTFDLAQKLMAERVNEYNEQRTMPGNTSGQSLLSGNVFCGHCGGRLTLTTNGTARRNAEGERVARRRIRYVCYDKTRHRVDCSGQTGYTMHILNSMAAEVLHRIFDKMKTVRGDGIVSRTQMSVTANLKDQLAAAKREFAKATKEYEVVKAKLMAVIRGESNLPEDVLSEIAGEAKKKMVAESEKVGTLNAELDRSNGRADEIRRDYQNILKWSEMFDNSDMAVKKMVAGYLIKKIHVYADYRLHIEFNINFAQFELGLEIPNEYRGEDLV